MHPWKGIIEQYRGYLPVTDTTPVVSLGEGATPLVLAEKLSERVNMEIWLKVEGCNPTGSFKDRGMTMAISKAAEAGAKAVSCASTGNTSASAAAYAARAGLRCIVMIPRGNVALGKVAQAVMHGADVLEIDGNFDDAFVVSKALTEDYPVTFVNSINPFRIQGQKTCAFEICDSLGSAPDFHIMPVGNAGNITAQWMGYNEYGKGKPRMFGVQAAGSAPLVLGEPVTYPETLATAIRIGNPQSWDGAVAARDDSNGGIISVTDAEILEGYHLLASLEGVFCEPASAASAAGLLKLHDNGVLEAGKRAVLILTGHGLKDPDRALVEAPTPVRVPADAREIADRLGFV